MPKKKPKNNNLMKKILIYLFFITSISQSGYSQACGGGILTFNIYILNGIEIDKFYYEILPVSKELLEEKFYSKVVNKVNLDNQEYELFRQFNEYGTIITEYFANEIIKTNDEKINENLNKMLVISKITQKGKFKSSLSFVTLETRIFPIILKITHKWKTIYILSNYFGGCDREASLVWNKGYGKLN